jgi:hypothetical protein
MPNRITSPKCQNLVYTLVVFKVNRKKHLRANAEMTTFTTNETIVISIFVARKSWKRGETVAANVC